jgi:ribosome biogenesis GTPase
MPKKIVKKRKTVRRRQWDPADADTLARESRARREDRGSVRLPPEDRDFFTDCESNALVITPYGALAFVLRIDTEYLCRVDDKLMDGKTSVLAPGDEVFVEEDGEDLVIRAVRPRRSKLSRPAVGRNGEQVLAANIDCVVIVASVSKPAFSPGLIDRYLVAAQAGGARPLLVVNKMDLGDREPAGVQPYRDLGIEVFNTSCAFNMGFERLRGALAGRVSVLSGHSGVGKSSIITALQPAILIDTQEISESTQKGRHTTTYSKLYALENGATIIDTPGIKQLGLWGITPEELDYYFHDIAKYAADCRFRNCTHLHEPHCAVKAALESHHIAKARYDSYVRIRETLVEETAPDY